MKEEFGLYVESLFHNVPRNIYIGLLLIFYLGAVFLLTLYRKRAWKRISALLLTEYLFLICCFTVLFRSSASESKHDFTPFWSYERPDLIVENIMNVLAFIPIGILLKLTYKKVTWWKTLLIGGGLSIGIELLQFILKRGFSEVDDVIHNTLGCMIGNFIFSLIKNTYEKISKRNVGVL